MDMHQAFLEWRLHYGAAPGEIESGDLPLRTRVIPVLAQLRTQALFARCELMRYSLQGYHWRVKLRLAAGGDLDALSAGLEAALRAQGDAEAAPGGELPLGGFALRLHERISQQPDAMPSGHQHWLRREEEVSLFEDAEVYDDWTAWADASSRLLMAVKAQRPSLRVERQFWRLYLFELLRGAGLRPVELHYASCFIERQWARFFSVDDAMQDDCRRTADTLAPRLLDFLLSHDRVEEVAASLPPSLARTFAEALPAHRQQLAGQMRRDERGELTNPSALRLGAVIHLVHNRAGLGIDQELVFCRLGQHFWGSQLAADAVSNNERWAPRNLDAYFNSQSVVI